MPYLFLSKAHCKNGTSDLGNAIRNKNTVSRDSDIFNLASPPDASAAFNKTVSLSNGRIVFDSGNYPSE